MDTARNVASRWLIAVIAVSLCLLLSVSSVQSPVQAWSNGSSGQLVRDPRLDSR
jgi:hypothetical protein